MEGTFTYPQDTITTKRLLKIDVSNAGPTGLKVHRTPVLNNVLAIPKTNRVQKQPVDTVKQNKPPTMAQIRYWHWLREQKMVVGDSRYIQPKTKVKLVSTATVDTQGLRLPFYKYKREHTDWITILLLLVLLLFATVRNSFAKYLVHLFYSLINYPTAVRMFNEKNNSVLHVAFRLDIYFYLTFSLFLYQLFTYSHLVFPFAGFSLFLVCLGWVVTFFLVKKMIYKALGLIFERKNETDEYLFNLDNFNRVVGLFLFPVVLLTAFNPCESPYFPMLVGVFILIGFYVLLLQRGISIFLKKQFSIFYLFLYLCTLEFLPLLLIYKVVVEN